MKLSIIIIGDEILLGQVTDTNSGEIARHLGPLGWEVVETYTVGDNAETISNAIITAMSQSDLVITTGGLGPTRDDITKNVLTDYFGGELRVDSSVARNIEEVFNKRGLQLNELTRNQAIVPTSCRVIQNKLGTAPIMWFERNGKVLIAMPGVPFETVGMLRTSVIDEITNRFEPDAQLSHHTVIVSGVTESDLAGELAIWESSLPEGVHLAYLPVGGYIRLRLDGKNVDPAVYDGIVEQLRQHVADWLVHDGDATPAEILLETLRARGLTVACAESCTGGNIAHHITSVAGSSDCFLGAVVSYANSVKVNVLRVNEGDLAAYGAVSEAVVRQMAEGVTGAIGSDCSIATSGIAGPGGGTEYKPVGTVWIAVHTPQGTDAVCKHFPGNRERIIERATIEGIMMLIRKLKGES